MRNVVFVRPRLFHLLAAAAVLSATASLAATIYLGGEILTMRGPQPEYAEAIVVRDGTIVFAGPAAEARSIAGAAAKTVDLGGKTLLPGFIDTHGPSSTSARTSSTPISSDAATCPTSSPA